MVRGHRANTPDVINLLARKGSSQDLAECYALHEALRLPYTKRSWRVLPEMWRTLLSKGAMLLCPVADCTKLVGSRIVSFGASVFVTDEFCLEVRSKLSPYLGVELARQYLSRQLPVLNREQIAQANAGDGLNVMMCFQGWTQDGLSAEQLFAVRAKQSEALHLALSGYRVKEFLANPLGADTSQWLLDAGARLRRDYSSYFRKNHLPKPESSRQPYLVGLTKQDAFTHPGSNLAGLFVYTTPRFHFNRSQRVLLRHALMGETCEELAKSLSISHYTVKKRWHAIYDRVADVDSELLPQPIAYGLHATSRGPERRRRLLNYLRQHFEELRPFEPASHGRRNKRTFSSARSIFVAATAFLADYLPCLCEGLV
jgi:hypothetical protein